VWALGLRVAGGHRCTHMERCPRIAMVTDWVGPGLAKLPPVVDYPRRGMELKSRRARRVIAIVGVVWIVTFTAIYLVAKGGPMLWRVAVIVYGGFGLVMMDALWFGKDERAVLGRAQIVAFIVASSLVVLGALL
jgi:hypothetical protein